MEKDINQLTILAVSERIALKEIALSIKKEAQKKQYENMKHDPVKALNSLFKDVK
jgi:hypothetical protein